MLNVVYEISALGQGHRYGRTGIFRAIENFVYRILESKECNVSFCSTESLSDLNSTLDYLKSNQDFSCVPFLSSESEKYLYRPLSQRAILPDKWHEIGVLPGLVQRVLWKLLFLVETTSTCLDPRQLKDKDIFHSTLVPLPPLKDSRGGLKRFLTVHDLIPILHPEFFTSNLPARLKVEEACASLQPDDWAVCVSQSTKNDLCNYRSDLKPDQVFVTPLAAAAHFRPASSAEITVTRRKYSIPECPYLLSLCTLEPRKNIERLIRSFLTLIRQEKIDDLFLVLVGSKGWDYDRIFGEILGAGELADRIIATGFVADSDLSAIYSGALAFVYPSLYEGFGLPPLEAMQCGIPVITSNVSSLPEVVGDAGIMVDPKDLDGLCDSLFRVYSDSTLRARLSELSLLQASKFSWENCAKQTIYAYKQAMSA